MQMSATSFSEPDIEERAVAAGEEPTPQRNAQSVLSSKRRAVVWVLVCGLLLIRFLALDLVRVESTSMMPTLRPHSLLLIDTFTYRFRSPRIGEIVVAELTESNESNDSIIKRVVGVSGDAVAIEDGVLLRNGRVVVEPYASKHNMGGYYFGPIVVPPNAVFLLGDNRGESNDSRTFGSIPTEQVEGRLIATLLHS
jgi:signal peptidase I